MLSEMSAQISPDQKPPLSELDMLNISFAEEDRATISLAMALRQKSRALRAASESLRERNSQVVGRASEVAVWATQIAVRLL